MYTKRGFVRVKYPETKNETPKDDSGASAAMMSDMMNINMPLLMGFMAYSLASGLALYFLVSNIFTHSAHPENMAVLARSCSLLWC